MPVGYCVVSRDLARHLDDLDREHLIDRWRDEFLSFGVRCPVCGDSYFPYLPQKDSFLGSQDRARNGWRENFDEGWVEWRRGTCEIIVRLEVP